MKKLLYILLIPVSVNAQNLTKVNTGTGTNTGTGDTLINAFTKVNNDITTISNTFSSIFSALYYLSNAVGASVTPSVIGVADVGAFQYNSILTSDSRNLSNPGSDYWQSILNGVTNKSLNSYTNQGTVYYVSTTGSSGNSGTSTGSPWPLGYALTTVTAGNTIIVMPGTYSGDWEITTSNLLVKSQNRWAARLVNMPYGLVLGYNSSAQGITIDGFEIANSSLNNVEISSAHTTVRNCWIHDAGSVQRPVSTQDAGSGIITYVNAGTNAVDYVTIEYNLIENNGASPAGDHGIYAVGKNLLVRGNVCRGNWGMGMQLDSWHGEQVSGLVYDNLVYGNGVNGKGAFTFTDGVLLRPIGGNLYFYNNTVVSTAQYGYALSVSDGPAYATNNIFVSGGLSSGVGNIYVGPLYEDYNTVSATLAGGPHDVISAANNFVSTVSGLYWLAASSPARGIANTNYMATTNFWGN